MLRSKPLEQNDHFASQPTAGVSLSSKHHFAVDPARHVKSARGCYASKCRANDAWMQSLKQGRQGRCPTLSQHTDPATEANPAFKAGTDEFSFPNLADAYEISTR